MKWNCPDCNSENSEDVIRCTCGYSTESSPTYNVSSVKPKALKALSQSKNNHAVLIGLLLSLLILMLILFITPSEKVHSLSEAWLRIKNDPAQKCLDNARIGLNDPESARIISFSYDQNELAHVLKYRAKNSYGSYSQGEFFCDSSGGPDNMQIEREIEKLKRSNEELRKAKNRNPKL